MPLEQIHSMRKRAQTSISIRYLKIVLYSFDTGFKQDEQLSDPSVVLCRNGTSQRRGPRPGNVTNVDPEFRG